MFLDLFLVFYIQKWAAADLHFINHQGPRFQLKIFLTIPSCLRLQFSSPEGE